MRSRKRSWLSFRCRGDGMIEDGAAAEWRDADDRAASGFSQARPWLDLVLVGSAAATP
jgi:hypothetical protein